MTTPMIRPATADDLAAVCDVNNRAMRADGIPQVRALDELIEDLEADDVDLVDDMRVAVSGDEVVGYVYTAYLPSEVVHERCYVSGDVDPAWRGKGIGRELMAWALARGRQQLEASTTDLPKHLHAQCGADAAATIALYERMGLRPVRYHDELLRPLTALPELRQPVGVRVVPWPDDRDDEILVVKNAAFADHWGSTPTSSEGWQSMVRGFGSRPEWSVIAVDAASGEVVGHCLCKRFADDDAITGRSDGYIASVGTLRSHRGRGIASAMIAHTLHAFAAAGLTHATIGVDSENPSGAGQIYRALGFVPHRADITYAAP